MGSNSPTCRCAGNLNEVKQFAIMTKATENDSSELLAMDSFTNLKTFHFLLAPKDELHLFPPPIGFFLMGFFLLSFYLIVAAGV